jgi:hypothetical protein
MEGNAWGKVMKQNQSLVPITGRGGITSLQLLWKIRRFPIIKELKTKYPKSGIKMSILQVEETI